MITLIYTEMKYVMIIFCLLLFTKSYSCGCISKSTLKSEIKRSDVIFEGIILEKKIIKEKAEDLPPDLEALPLYSEYTILIKKTFKGATVNDTIKINTGLGKGDCGYRFIIGKTYMIYAEYTTGYVKEKYLYTDVCMRTALYNEKEEKKLKKFHKLLRT